MAATSSISYTAGTITITYASLANAGWQQSTAVDNTTALYTDALVGGKCVLGTTIAADGQLEFYAYASYDGTTYNPVPGSTDATITWGTNCSALGYQDLKFLGVARVDDTDDDDTVEWGPFPIAAAFGGTMPQKWGIVMKNSTGVTMAATQTGAEAKYVGIKMTSA